MKKSDLIKLIKAHYEKDSQTFFDLSLSFSEELRKESPELSKLIDDILSTNCTIAPIKRECLEMDTLVKMKELYTCEDANMFIPMENTND